MTPSSSAKTSIWKSRSFLSLLPLLSFAWPFWLAVFAAIAASNCLSMQYCERRQVPPENLLRISWPGGNIEWTPDDFQTKLVAPLLSMLSSRALTNQIDFVVLSMDIPFRIFYGSGNNSTTSALFYGLKDE